jgi:hypothetical protein
MIFMRPPQQGHEGGSRSGMPAPHAWPGIAPPRSVPAARSRRPQIAAGRPGRPASLGVAGQVEGLEKMALFPWPRRPLRTPGQESRHRGACPPPARAGRRSPQADPAGRRAWGSRGKSRALKKWHYSPKLTTLAPSTRARACDFGSDEIWCNSDRADDGSIVTLAASRSTTQSSLAMKGPTYPRRARHLGPPAPPWKFVGGCADDRLKQAVCRRILELADGFGVRTVPRASRPERTLSRRTRWVSIWSKGFLRETRAGQEFARTVLRHPGMVPQ